MPFSLYDARVYMGKSLVFHTYYHSNQLPFPSIGMSDTDICLSLNQHITKHFVREEKFMNVAECLVTIFGCDFKDPLPIDQRYFAPYMIRMGK